MNNKYQRLQKGIGDLWTVSYFFSNTLYPTLISLVYTIALLAFVRPHYIIVYLIYCIGFFIILHYFYDRIQRLNEKLNKAMEDVSGAHIEGLGNILTKKLSGAQKKFEYDIRHISIIQWQVYQIHTATMMGIFLVLPALMSLMEYCPLVQSLL